ncbi:hypothetical protein GQ43DRAFT_360937 [Delitschia confertaspora ATCC 74209]|uniref:Mid2 domain-containing protein n=1 Tax=Delitschia confertaspora ATCC 74209 TaxID=1513339 RepID=A0A9P4JX70_9PLEO|nr:hypothetical protein GQ43DRAFT_360937 [Delitschia confertaspora ATCC 74209]
MYSKYSIYFTLLRRHDARVVRDRGLTVTDYPNGNLSPSHNDMPCSTQEGAACCPDKWQCLDNGLCYYPPDNLYGRYGCTDQSWKSPYCASNLCTYNMTAAGDEAITQCSGHGNQWCCDGDRVHRDCCTDNSMPFFDLSDGKAYATIGSGSTPSNAPTLATIQGPTSPQETGGGGGGGNSKSSSPFSSAAPSASSTPASSKPSSAPASKDSESSTSDKSSSPSMTQSVQTSISSGSAGVSTIIITTNVPAASAASSPKDPQSKPSSKSKLPIIVGCAVGIPLGLAVLVLLALLYRRRRRSSVANPPEKSIPSPDPAFEGSAFAGGAAAKHGAGNKTYRHDPAIPELGSQPVGPGRPISTIKGMAELEGGAGFAPGATPHAPHLVGVGGGNSSLEHTPQSSWGSAPPGYSPAQNQAGFSGTSGAAAGAGGGQPGQEQSNVTGGGRYIPYRPPQAQPQNPPENVAELPAMKTPPA